MPLPSEHIRRFEHDLRIHERRLAFLRNEVDRFTGEAEARELILQLGRDLRVLGLVQDIQSLMDDTGEGLDAMVMSLRAEPEAVLGRASVELPAGWSVRIDDLDDRLVVGIDLTVSSWRLSCEWDSIGGFRLVQHNVDEFGANGGDAVEVWI